MELLHDICCMGVAVKARIEVFDYNYILHIIACKKFIIYVFVKLTHYILCDAHAHLLFEIPHNSSIFSWV